MTTPIWIVKLGGSLIGSPALKVWLNAILSIQCAKIVVVPGGGLMADAVRIAQEKTGMSDEAAHQMAVLSMVQYGVLLSDLAPEFLVANTLDALLESPQHTIWQPDVMVLADPDIHPSWKTTSDSLAAYLAGLLHVHRLVLVKSIDAIAAHLSLAQLSAQGVVDEHFLQYVSASTFKVQVLGAMEIDRLKKYGE